MEQPIIQPIDKEVLKTEMADCLPQQAFQALPPSFG